jgi:hypothetical protein
MFVLSASESLDVVGLHDALQIHTQIDSMVDRTDMLNEHLEQQELYHTVAAFGIMYPLYRIAICFDVHFIYCD